MRITIDKNFRDNTPCPKLDYISEIILSQLLKSHEPPEHWRDALSNCNWNFSDKDPEYGAIFIKKFTMPDGVFHWSLTIIAHADITLDGYQLNSFTFTLPDGSEKKTVPTPLQCLYTEARFAPPKELNANDTWDDEDGICDEVFNGNTLMPTDTPIFFRTADEITRFLKTTDTVIHNTLVVLLQSLSKEPDYITRFVHEHHVTFNSPLIRDYEMFLKGQDQIMFLYQENGETSEIPYQSIPISLKLEIIKEIAYNTIQTV